MSAFSRTRSSADSPQKTSHISESITEGTPLFPTQNPALPPHLPQAVPYTGSRPIPIPVPRDSSSSTAGTRGPCQQIRCLISPSASL